VAVYTARAGANSNGTANIEDLFLEIKAPASQYIRIRRVRIETSSGAITTVSDNYATASLYHESAAGTGGISGPITAKDANAPASQSSFTVKNGVTNFSKGTVVNTFQVISIPRNTGIWEFLALDNTDSIVIAAGNYFAVGLTCVSVTAAMVAIVEWEE